MALSTVSHLRQALLPSLRVGVPLALLSHQLRFHSKTVLSAQAQTVPATYAEEEDDVVNSTIADILGHKSQKDMLTTLWCTPEDTVFDAVKKMTNHNVGALVVMKPGDTGNIAGIITERDYLRKIAVENRTSKTTRVGEIMTVGERLVTVTSETKVLKAMELMTDHKIRHIPVVENDRLVAMVSIGDVVKTVVEEQRDEVKRLSDFIQGNYSG